MAIAVRECMNNRPTPYTL